MIKVENVEVTGFEASIRGMRNPKNSWHLSDSMYCFNTKDCEYNSTCESCLNPYYVVGERDLNLMQRLFSAGTEHRKYLRMINVTMDVTCNAVWWQEFDTYKVGTVRNSCSKMHKIHVKAFELDDFSHEGIDEVGTFVKQRFESHVLGTLEWLRVQFNETGEKKYWRALLELLPHGYNMRATVQFNYEVLFNILRQRSNHKWFEWRIFCDELRHLPYVNQIEKLAVHKAEEESRWKAHYKSLLAIGEKIKGGQELTSEELNVYYDLVGIDFKTS